ncbi:MAG: hypothetical protein A2V91_00720 [Candidatus Muproteobacteria bacterium RBG_16_64_10]|uniref:Glycosyltransferase RgtA/B/C/D-like domain-containing protein n=1 Tax=Candidatus Muproteobacteria bacterium RBG_16_64_10 TaxID=1817757 RepID=A0A1F6T736_9PROT|nr:MAG: hypothetical protein A2V91_00720 [Candidatus Muproteobacteria bacterium RBG_16_64_10]
MQLLLWRWADREGFTPIFRFLLRYYDAHGNLLLLAVAVCAWLLRRQPAALAAVRFAAERPWTIAAALFPLLCLGSLHVYHAYPLSMDEYAAVFQAEAFAAGRLGGAFPPDLLDRLIPPYFQNGFLAVSRTSGEVSANNWPGFSLLLAPFAWLGIPWAANPAIGALAVPALHRLTQQVTGSQEAAGWAVALMIASPVFALSSISFYSMQASLLSHVLYAILLLQPTVPRALLAGVIGSVALTLHQPLAHLLFFLPFAAWLVFRPDSIRILAALLIGYLPLAIPLGIGWHMHLVELMQGADAAGSPPTGQASLDSIMVRVGNVFSLPAAVTIEARIAGLSKIWTWGVPGLLVLAAWGYAARRDRLALRLLGAALAATFFGYFLFRVEQGHGWGYRYMHSAWFILPLLAAAALSIPLDRERAQLRAMVAWAILISLVAGNAQRLVQAEAFIGRHLSQVPPLARAPEPGRRELVFVNPAAGSYLLDIVQNDPFLRAPRIVMLLPGPESTAELVRLRFPGYILTAQGEWGELWTAPRDN